MSGRALRDLPSAAGLVRIASSLVTRAVSFVTAAAVAVGASAATLHLRLPAPLRSATCHTTSLDGHGEGYG